MTRIKYKIADGKVIEVEVGEAVGKLLIDFERQEKSESRKMRWRKEQSIESIAEQGMNIVDNYDVFTEFADKERRELLFAAIKRLKPQQQKTIELAYFQGMQKQEIARLFGVSNGAITQQILAIHRKLKEILRET